MANPSNSNETTTTTTNQGGNGFLGNIASQTREYIHETVKTQEQRDAEKEAEKPWTEKIPEFASQVGQRMKEKAAEDAGVAGKEGGGGEEQQQQQKEKPNMLGLGTIVDATKSTIDQTRTTIYNATKSQEEIEKEKEAQKTMTEKVKDRLPGSATDAGQKIGQAIDNGVESVKTKFNERLDEDTYS